MRDKDRLKEVRKSTLVRVHPDKEATVELPKRYFDYLYQQAKRVQELEKYVQKLQSNIYDTDKVLFEVNQDRKRYREALEFYADKLNYGYKTDSHGRFYPSLYGITFSNIDHDSGNKARKVLEGAE